MSRDKTCSTPRRIAVLRHRYIGDTLLTLPFLDGLRQLYPNAEINVYTGPGEAVLLENCPYINRVIGFEPKKTGFWKSVSLLKKARYDRIYILKRSFSTALIAYLAEIPQRIGFDTEHRGFLLTRKITYQEEQQHEAQCYLDLLEMPGLKLESLNFKLAWLPDSVRVKAQQTWPKLPGIQRIGLHATSTNISKCWPLSHFTSLAMQLLQHSDSELYFLGTPADRDVYNALITGCPESVRARCHNLSGETTLIESLAVIATMDLVVANDSGMVHLAAAVDTPVVALFGPMNPRQWHPLSNRYQILTPPGLSLELTKRERRLTINLPGSAMKDISPEDVYSACKPYLIV